MTAAAAAEAARSSSKKASKDMFGKRVDAAADRGNHCC